MSRVKVQEFRSLSDAEIELKKSTLEKALFELRQKQITGQLEKPHEFKMLRRQIAQLNTVQTEQKNASAGAAPQAKPKAAVSAVKAQKPAKSQKKTEKKK